MAFTPEMITFCVYGCEVCLSGRSDCWGAFDHKLGRWACECHGQLYISLSVNEIVSVRTQTSTFNVMDNYISLSIRESNCVREDPNFDFLNLFAGKFFEYDFVHCQ